MKPFMTRNGALEPRWGRAVPKSADNVSAVIRAGSREILRLDAEVLEWLRSKGEGHLTRINDILTNLMEAERRMGSGK